MLFVTLLEIMFDADPVKVKGGVVGIGDLDHVAKGEPE
jgi:hypothetical protein